MSRVVIVEGLIGSGKTTLTRELGEALGPTTLTLFEPDEKSNRNPYLASYYADPARWSFTMQCHLLSSRFRIHLHAQWHALQGAGHAVIDRSFYGDTCFAQVQRRLGLMTPDEFLTYRTLYRAMTASVLLPSVCVRVLTTPETCAQRIAERMERETGRRCESVIERGYLLALDEEIGRMVEVLRQSGVYVLEVPWDVVRDTPQQRQAAVQGLAARISSQTHQELLDTHTRVLP